MEADASRLKDVLRSEPPLDLLAYLWSRMLVHAMNESEEGLGRNPETDADKAHILAVLEYAHAVWSCFPPPPGDSEATLSQHGVEEAIDLVGRLRKTALAHSVASRPTANIEVLGEASGFFEFNAKTAWILIRGNRYQVLEEEFFRFVLAPHDDSLLLAYGIGSADVAAGIQAISTSMREGISAAFETIETHMNLCHSLAEQRGITVDEAIRELTSATPNAASGLRGAMQDVFRGGVCNVSRHTKLPVELLRDLAYERGENQEFFSPGPFSGTPLRTLPARIRPLIRLADGFYATDGTFVRDAAYRAIERGVSVRLPEGRQRWNERQKALTETAFQRIFSTQLRDATVLTGVYYRDVATAWVEVDAIIIIDDVMLQVEAKAGVGAMHSPATHFTSHVRAIRNLILKAHEQTKRFFDYLASARSVPLYRQQPNGQFVEICQLSLSNFRVLLPIGLTVESFSPFSAMCKDIPALAPLLGRHPFISMSIDDLFVLNRFLRTTGELLHYLKVRQSVAGITGARLFDELDHLGAYIAKNRFDIDLRSQRAEADQVTWDGFSAEIDRYFSGDNWRNERPPHQTFPPELRQILDLLEADHPESWLAVDARIRDLGDSDRHGLSARLRQLADSLRSYPHRWFASSGGVQTLMIWLFRSGDSMRRRQVIRQAELLALATESSDVLALCVGCEPDGRFVSARSMRVERPREERPDFDGLVRDASALTILPGSLMPTTDSASSENRPRLGRNDPCWCGSGRKYKRCHGR